MLAELLFLLVLSTILNRHKSKDLRHKMNAVMYKSYVLLLATYVYKDLKVIPITIGTVGYNPQSKRSQRV